jgi:transcriptional regulator with XRE-family HTH domain
MQGQTFGALLSAAMKDRAISNGALATKLNVMPSTVWCWLTDRHAPSVNLIPEIARALGVKAERLLPKPE